MQKLGGIPLKNLIGIDTSKFGKSQFKNKNK